MPKRLLSFRGRRTDQKLTVFDPPEYFDFDFRAKAPASGDDPDGRRPSSAGANYGRIPRHEEIRPQTSDRLIDKRLEHAKAESNWIGVAIGSPTHPPTIWNEAVSPHSPKDAFRNEGPLPSQVSSKWKKIGVIFRNKSPSHKISLQPELGKNTNESMLPKNQYAKQQTNPSSDILQSGPVPLDKPLPPLTTPCETETRPTKKASVPKLEIEIPTVELDRYSVMFRGIAGLRSSQSIQRKSRVAQNPRDTQSAADQKLPPLPSPRRTASAAADISTYSLFPSLNKRGSIHVSPANHVDNDRLHRRSVSTPAKFRTIAEHESCLQESTNDDQYSATQLIMPSTTVDNIEFHKPSTSSNESHELSVDRASPLMECSKPAKTCQTIACNTHGLSAKPEPLRLRRSLPVDYSSSPEECENSDKDDVPWRSTDSLQSSGSSTTSVEEEIFFDLKPCRDSNGMRNSQYVVTKPDAAAVQLARSISQQRRKKNLESPTSQEVSGYQWSPEMEPGIWTMPPDVQAAEHFCMSSDMQSAQPVLRLSMFDKAIEEVERLASPSEPIASEAIASVKPPRMLRKPHLQLPSRSKGLAIGIPSPITERSFEETPKATPVIEAHPNILTQKSHIASQATHSPTIIVQSLSFEQPPPVPRKDSKFLTQRQNAKNEAMQKRERRRSRSRVESSHPPRTSSADPSRSRARTSGNESRPRKRYSKEHKQYDQSVIVARAVKHAAEISIARKVSLSRSPSHKIVVKRHVTQDHVANGHINSHRPSNHTLIETRQ